MMYFIWEKNQWQYFSSEKFSFNESQLFLKIWGEDILMGPAVAFILGPGKMRTIAPVKLCVWYLGPLHYGSDDCCVSSGTIKSPLL